MISLILKQVAFFCISFDLLFFASQATLSSQLPWPPRLLQDQPYVQFRSKDVLRPFGDLRPGIEIAKTPPRILFMYYPCQTYPGNPWSNWGDGLCTDRFYFSSLGDHKAPEGNAFVYKFDYRRNSLSPLVDLRSLLKLPAGYYSPGKIHGRLDQGRDGWIYFSTHRGSTRVTTERYHFKGDWIIRVNPVTREAQIVAHAPLPMQCIPASVLDPKRMIFYGGTAAGDYRDKRIMFFAYDVLRRKLIYSCYGGPYRYLILSSSTGRVYFTPSDSKPLRCFDPELKAVRLLPIKIGLRASTSETPQGLVYTVGRDGTLWSFNVKTEEARKIGPAQVGKATYITSVDADSSGHFLYYVPGAHGDAYRDGSPVVQFDVVKKRKKVIAFLYPFLKERLGYVPLGTYSTALSPDGTKLFVTWNGNRLGQDSRGRFKFDTCAMTEIDIPAGER